MLNNKSNGFDTQRVDSSNQGFVNSNRNHYQVGRSRFRNGDGSVRLAVMGSNHGLGQASRGHLTLPRDQSDHATSGNGYSPGIPLTARGLY